MKKLVLIISAFICVVNFLNAQSVSYSEINDANYSGLTGDVREYIAINGQTFKVGDLVTIGKPSNKINYRFIEESVGLGASIANKGALVEITALKIKKFGKINYEVVAKAKGRALSKVTIRIDQAIKVGEIECPDL